MRREHQSSQFKGHFPHSDTLRPADTSVDRGLARLREAHREEYEQYLDQERASSLAVFEEKWSAHLAGDHGGRDG